MNDRLRLDHESCARCAQFLTDNAADFNIGLVKAKRLTFADAVNDAEAKDAAFSGFAGETSMEFEQKETARSVLRADIAEIADMAIGMEPDFNGISDLFRFRRGLPDAGLLALGRAFVINAAAYESDFIDRGLAPNFRTNLTTHADDFEAATGAASSAKGERVGENAALAEAVKLEMQMKRSLDPIVRTKYKGQTAKLAAWASAYHVEKAPSKPPPPTPTP